uniref:Uncharacterized protein n=1 Tax=Parazoarcus communis TaxID=41977 RepID=Q1KY46_9RHOO|nr:hypothetical protein [Parazoarcus communis]
MRKTICSRLGFSSPRTASKPPTGCSIRSRPIRERCFCSREWVGLGTNWRSVCAVGRRRRPISSFISLTTMGSRLCASCTTPGMFPRSGTGQSTENARQRPCFESFRDRLPQASSLRIGAKYQAEGGNRILRVGSTPRSHPDKSTGWISSRSPSPNDS